MVCTLISLIFFESLSSFASISAARAERDEANITLQHCFYGSWPERQVVPILSCRQQKLPSRNYFIFSWVAPLAHPCPTTTHPWIPRVTIRLSFIYELDVPEYAQSPRVASVCHDFVGCASFGTMIPCVNFDKCEASFTSPGLRK
jgi:hypothetical protein